MSEIQLENYKNYLATIDELAGSQIFRHLYARRDGVKIDLVDDGDLSCALVVSSVLLLFGWIDGRHATVKSTVNVLADFGWRATENPRPGDVVVWPRDDAGGEHIGFYRGGERAVSNISAKHAPGEHDIILRGGFRPKAFFTRDYD